MISAGECLELLGAGEAIAQVEPFWEESQAEYPGGRLFFLQPDFWRENREKCSFGPDYDVLFQRVADEITGSEALNRLVWHMYWRVFCSQVPAPLDNQWPEPGMLGEARGLPGLLLALSWAPLLRQYHQQLGLPEQATRETLQQVRHFCEENYRRAFQGRPGIFLSQLSWLRNYLKNPYIRIGRLEYCLQASPDPVLVYRQRNSQKVIALSEAGLQFTREGYRLGSAEECANEQGSWFSELEFSSGAVSGNPLLPEGRALQRKVCLSLQDWEQVFARGDDCLRMHIPPGGGMAPEVCAASLQRARDFFRQYFPDRNIRAVSCGSWIFNPELEEIMPAGANLPAFQRELYLYPVPGGPWDGLWFIFLKTGRPDASYPRNTDLQRRILQFIEQGRRWRCGGMLILLEDIARFGSAFYRENFPRL